MSRAQLLRMRGSTVAVDDSAQIVAFIPRLRSYARALVGNRAPADDLVQDTLERAWSSFHLWQRGRDMRAWLFSIMHNVYVDQLRRPTLATQALDDAALDVPIRASQDDLLEVRDLEAALRALPDEQREILLFVALEQMTYEEVAKVLRIPLGTVMSRLSRARDRLRAQLEGQPLAPRLKVVK